MTWPLDVERVTGRKPALKQATAGLSENAVLVGTLGKSPVIDRLVKDGRLDVEDVQGQWESFVIATVADPVAGCPPGFGHRRQRPPRHGVWGV